MQRRRVASGWRGLDVGGAGRGSPVGTGRTDRGSISAFVVLLLVAIMALMGLVVDGGSAMSAQQSAYDEAEQAARAGAGELSIDGLRSGMVTLDDSAAVSRAVAFTVAAGHPGTATAEGGTVRVEIHYRMATDVLGIIGIDSLPVSAAASATDVHGVTSAAP
jgi:Putative Flp pilus-assembly TadE/G-like